jgi:hypothetical protein
MSVKHIIEKLICRVGNMLTAVLLMLFIGLITSLALAVASRVFYVWEDLKELAIADALPGANCGACGYPGCRASAKAIAAKEQGPKSLPKVTNPWNALIAYSVANASRHAR